MLVGRLILLVYMILRPPLFFFIPCRSLRFTSLPERAHFGLSP